ncbi:MAG TPA: hypothetical protein VME70_14650 [Mycobacteriales bacterium]|nr:hypothetical protein [Mycobacteriales bacterium]
MPNRPTADRLQAPPERNADFDHLSLDGLRHYRATLSSEEGRVSYWRRIIQARLDLVRAAETGASASVEDLTSMFTEERLTGNRSALITIVPVDDMPPLPDLGSLWARQPKAGDDEHNAELIKDLSAAEIQLSAYRSALHRRLSAATGELIARYREHPDLCLSVLPSPPNTPKAASQ